MLQQFKRRVRERLSGPMKQNAEREFWTEELEKYVDWYTGAIEELYGLKPPTDTQKVKAQTVRDSAILTWFDLHQKPKYLADLQLPANAFKGLKVLDVGAGPMPSALGFDDIDLYCLDQLYADYLASGFPIHYWDNVRFMNASSEDIPAQTGFFDAVISVNAIDHVDDIHKTAQEIKRVLKPGGKFAMHVHYHEATTPEPLEFTDEKFLAEFGWVKDIKKVSVSDKKTGSVAAPGESYVVWRNF